MLPAYYNERQAYRCEVLRARIRDGLLPPGDVDGRDVRDVMPNDLRGYGQLHFFAGIGGAGLACRLAGLPDDVSLATAGFPCTDISVAGKGAGLHGPESRLFFELVRLLRDVRPRFVLLENSPALLSRGMGHVLGELAALRYDAQWDCVPASAVGARHRRDRVWIVGHAMADADNGRRETSGLAQSERVEGAQWRQPNRRSEIRQLDDAAAHLSDADGRPGPGRERHEAERAATQDAEPGSRRGSWQPGDWSTEPDVGRVVNGISSRLDRYIWAQRVAALGDAWVPQAAVPALRVIRDRLG